MTAFGIARLIVERQRLGVQLTKAGVWHGTIALAPISEIYDRTGPVQKRSPGATTMFASFQLLLTTTATDRRGGIGWNVG